MKPVWELPIRHRIRSLLISSLFLPIILLAHFTGCVRAPKEQREEAKHLVPKYDRFERTLISSKPYDNPLQQVELRAEFTSPTGRKRQVYGFWDGGDTWRIRFSPDEVGRWEFRTTCSDPGNQGLHGRTGFLLCSAPIHQNRFDYHGPVEVAPEGDHLQFKDGTPFLWIGDLAWNSALKATKKDWVYYLTERERQQFNAIEWMATGWPGAPSGDRNERSAFSGQDRIRIHPEFFQRLDERVEIANHEGFLTAPVMFWGPETGGGDRSPALSRLPEDQAILLARHMVARWGANDVVWILRANGHSNKKLAGRWKRIGQSVFGPVDHAPVALHGAPMSDYWSEFHEEEWLDIIGYQSGQDRNAQARGWLVDGPVSTASQRYVDRPFINLQPTFEGWGSPDSEAHNALTVRRTLYWSLLNAPTAGVNYGGHGVWAWSNGLEVPVGAPGSGVPLPWEQGLSMPAAEQVEYLADAFSTLPFWTLEPTPEVIAQQPSSSPNSYIAASANQDRDTVVIYTPTRQPIPTNPSHLPRPRSATWLNPRNGQESRAIPHLSEGRLLFEPPGSHDWLLVIQSQAL